LDFTGIDIVSRFLNLRLATAIALGSPNNVAHAEAAPATAPTQDIRPVYRLPTNSPTPTSFPRQYTLVADTDHSNIEIQRAFLGIFRNFIKNGGTDVFLEAESEYQKIFDIVKSGKAKLEQFSDVMHASGYLTENEQKEAQVIFQETMRLALDNNIGFHAIDREPQAIKDFPDVALAITTALRDGHPEKLDELRKDPAMRERFELFDKAFFAERDAVNAEVAEAMKALGPEAKVIALYGGDHALPIAKLLGQDRVQGIIMTPADASLGATPSSSPATPLSSAKPAPLAAKPPQP